MPTSEWLQFKAAHADACDAVLNDFDAEQIAAEIKSLDQSSIVLASAATDKSCFLQRPDLGRQLNSESRRQLLEMIPPNSSYDLSITVSDGLSALAAQRQAIPLLQLLLPKLMADRWTIAPIAVVRYGRVALQDEIGALFNSSTALILLGERPGLGAADSLGAYLVHAPRPGNTDANRNCVSNIRPQGLNFNVAAQTIHYLITEARRLKISGVTLKDLRDLPSLSKSRMGVEMPLNPGALPQSRK